MSTDDDWEMWGQRDPYFAVITDPKYRAENLTEDAKREFFASGSAHAGYILETARQRLNWAFEPKTALDFGCGTGRITIPLSERIPFVVGVDISTAMLQEAEKNASHYNRSNIRWIKSSDTLLDLPGPFDFIHSCITFQHIDVPRGRALFAKLVDLLAPGGIAAIQILYGKAKYPETFGTPPGHYIDSEAGSHDDSLSQSVSDTGKDPRMEMNAYSLSQLAYLIQTRGILEMYAAFTDHGGELGVFMYFLKPH